MSSGVKTPNLTQTAVSDGIIVNRGGNTMVQPTSSLAQQLSADLLVSADHAAAEAAASVAVAAAVQRSPPEHGNTRLPTPQRWRRSPACRIARLRWCAIRCTYGNITARRGMISESVQSASKPISRTCTAQGFLGEPKTGTERVGRQSGDPENGATIGSGVYVLEFEAPVDMRLRTLRVFGVGPGDMKISAWRGMCPASRRWTRLRFRSSTTPQFASERGWFIDSVHFNDTIGTAIAAVAVAHGAGRYLDGLE